MRLYEKILLAILLLTIIGQLFSIEESILFFCLLNMFLALSYFIGGYWMLNPKHNKRFLLPIVGGMALGSCLYVLTFAVVIVKAPIYTFLPLFNILFFIVLSIYVFTNKNKRELFLYYKAIYIRSIVILIIVGFFNYCPTSFKPYRSILIALNRDNIQLVNNLQMFNYVDEYDEAVKNKDYENAISYAKKANEAGKTWLGMRPKQEYKEMTIDSVRLKYDVRRMLDSISIQSKLWQIRGTYICLFRAYKYKAEKLYKQRAYKEALDSYRKANDVLGMYDFNSESWDLENVWILNQMAVCHKASDNYEMYELYINEMLEILETIEKENVLNVATTYSKLGESFAEQFEFESSNVFFGGAIAILQKEPLTKSSKADIAHNYFQLIQNHIKTDSLQKALSCIKKNVDYIDKTSLDACNIKLYNGIYLYKMSQYDKADKVLTECLDCIKEKSHPLSQSIAGTHYVLCRTKIALAQYDLAKEHIQKGLEITLQNFGENSVRHANFIHLNAFLNYTTSNYKEAYREYTQAIGIYTKELGEDNYKLPDLLSELANLEITLAKFKEAKEHSDKAYDMAEDYVLSEGPSFTNYINNAANVNYHIGLNEASLLLYEKSILINKKYGLKDRGTSPAAWNGLGLCMTTKKQYRQADIYFSHALKLHQKLFGENHPQTAMVYLNHALLKIKTGKLKEAEKMLNKSYRINKQFFKPKHDVFADIYIAFGDLLTKNKRLDTANTYYQKALEIYLYNFDESHLRVVATKAKIKASS